MSALAIHYQCAYYNESTVLIGVICFSDNGAAGNPGGGAVARAPVPKAEPKEE